jgi:cytochrome c-type biogenesis protein CcmE
VFRVWGLGVGSTGESQDLGFRVGGLVFRVSIVRCRDQVLEFRIEDSRFSVWGLEARS